MSHARHPILLFSLATIVVAIRYLMVIATQSPTPVNVSVRIAFTSYALLAAFGACGIAWRGWSTLPARALSLYFACAATSINAMALSSWLGDTIGFRIAGVAAAIGTGAIVYFSAVFAPSRMAQIISGRRIALASVALAVLLGAGILTLSLPFAILAVMTSAILVLIQLRAGYSVAGAEARKGIQWVVLAVVAGGTAIAIDLALVIVESLTGVSLPIPAWDAWLFILGLSIGLVILQLAVFYKGAVDPALLIKRTVLAGLVAPMLIFIYAGLENVIADHVAARLHFSPTVGSWIAGGLVAIGFTGGRKIVRSIRTSRTD